MKKVLLLCQLFLLLGFTSQSFAQAPLIDSWIINNTGTFASYWENTGTPMNPSYTFTNTMDSADVLQRCYDNDHVYVRAHGMTINMGQFSNPGVPTPQNSTWIFPRDTMPASNPTATSAVGAVGLLLNGIPIFGKGDGNSWDNNTQQNENMGQGIWNGEAIYGESISLDTAFSAHPQMQGIYHTHGTPHRLYPFPSTTHSPIIGFSFDGYPIYGPFGYSSAFDANSSVVQITSSYQLRSITQRTSLPDGTTLQANEYGPNVSTQHPLGEYIEDYEYVQGLGMLDDHNGRYCVTPEYPNGTYAYFVTADSNDEPAFPYFIGDTYFGVPEADNYTPGSNITIPANADCSLSIGIEDDEWASMIQVFPNPFQNNLTIDFGTTKVDEIRIVDVMGRTVFQKFDPRSTFLELETTNWDAGFYTCILTSREKSALIRLSMQF